MPLLSPRPSSHKMTTAHKSSHFYTVEVCFFTNPYQTPCTSRHVFVITILQMIFFLGWRHQIYHFETVSKSQTDRFRCTGHCMVRISKNLSFTFSSTLVAKNYFSSPLPIKNVCLGSTLNIFFCQIKSLLRFSLAFVFELQTL